MRGFNRVFLVLSATAIALISCHQDSVHCDKGTDCERCTPACASTEVCKNGQCLPKEQACMPACASTEVCKNGQCLPKEQACMPACASTEVCKNGQCLPKETICNAPKQLCDQICVDLESSPAHCGECNKDCGVNTLCHQAQCQCKEGYADWDKLAGCEINLSEVECQPGDEIECYPFDEKQLNFGCQKGKRQCIDGFISATCEGFVGPLPYDPSQPQADLNCNGQPDEDEDLDGDGYRKKDGDCCDDGRSCEFSYPKLISPSALELPNDKLDNNCNGKIDEEVELCESQFDQSYPKGTGKDAALALIRALDICLPEVSEESKQAGLIDYRLQSNEHGKAIDARSASALSMLENVTSTHKLLPQRGQAFALLSSGLAQSAKNGFSELHTTGPSTIPTPYAAVHSTLQSAAGCKSSKNINDMASLYLKMRVPSNAKGFRFKFRFFSVEYPRYLCSEYNDFFLALLQGQKPDIPQDKNIAFDKLGNPVSVNNAFFTSCKPLICAQCRPAIHACIDEQCHPYKDPSNHNLGTTPPCPDGDAGRLDLTTFNNSEDRGATAWLQTSAGVVPGEVIELTFYIWDTGDNKLDSTVILDGFEWLPDDTPIDTIIVN